MIMGMRQYEESTSSSDMVFEWIETEGGAFMTQKTFWENAGSKSKEPNLFSNHMKPKYMS